MGGCCSFKVIVGRVCGFNPKDRKRNPEIVPLLSCNWALVVPPRASSSRSAKYLLCLSSVAALTQLIVMAESHKTLQAKICDILSPCGDQATSDTQKKKQNRGPGGGVRICRVKKTCGSARGVRAQARPR